MEVEHSVNTEKVRLKLWREKQHYHFSRSAFSKQSAGCSYCSQALYTSIAGFPLNGFHSPWACAKPGLSLRGMGADCCMVEWGTGFVMAEACDQSDNCVAG